jgi:hypothetical protein
MGTTHVTVAVLFSMRALGPPSSKVVRDDLAAASHAFLECAVKGLARA